MSVKEKNNSQYVTREDRERLIITNTITRPENQSKDPYKGTTEALSNDKSEGTPPRDLIYSPQVQYLHGNNNKHVWTPSVKEWACKLTEYQSD